MSSLIPNPCICLILLGISELVRGANNPIAVNLPGAVPVGASKAVDSSYVGLGVETSSFPNYSGNNSDPNIFSRNLIESIYERQGGRVGIRVGGTSGDHGTYVPNQTEAVVRPASQDGKNVPMNITVGPSWFQGFQSFPGISEWTFMVPLAKANLANSVEESELAVKMIGLDNLYALEIGNEPNFYPGSDRPASYDPAEYVAQWKEWADALEGNISLPAGPQFQAIALASGAAPPWTVENVFNAGIDSTKMAKSVSTHYYQTSVALNAAPLLSATLMNHTALTSKLSTTITAVQFITAKYPDVAFIIGEVGASLNPTPANGATQNDYDLESVLGATLWNVDFMIYAMSQNVSRVSMQQGLGFGYAAWMPTLNPTTGSGPHVSAPYYALVMVADFVGNATDLQVIPVVQQENLSAYAGYESGSFSKMVIINLDEWNSTTPTARPVQKLDLTLPSDVMSVKVEKLTGPGASAMDNVTWAGTMWSYETMGMPVHVKNDTETLQVTGGKVTVKVQASEAVMLTVE